MSQNSAFDDTNIPVLTEVVLDKAPAAAAAPAVPVANESAVEEHAAASLSEPDWSLLERRISERLLQQLQDRVDVVLQDALAGLADEIRAALRQSLEPIVVQAVAQEVAQLQTLKE